MGKKGLYKNDQKTKIIIQIYIKNKMCPAEVAACNQMVKEKILLLNHPLSRARGHSLNIQKECHLPHTVLALTFLSVCQKAPPGPVWPVCGTAAETPQKKTADSPAPPTCTQKLF